MKKNLRNEAFLLAAAIICSVLVWFIIIYAKNPTIDITVKNIPVEFTYEDELNSKGLCVIHQEKPLTASAVLSGKRNDLFHVIGRIDARINLSEIDSAGTTGMDVDFSFPSGAAELAGKRSSVIVTIEKTAEKDIPVVINQSGTNKNYLVKSSAEPAVIHISGAESEINKIAEAVVRVDISSFSEDSSAELDYVFTDEAGNETEPSVNIMPSDESVTVNSSLYRKKVVNIEAGIPESAAAKYDVRITGISPSECVAGARGEQYDSFKSVPVILPEDISAGQGQRFDIPVSVPDDICVEKDTDITVYADIEEKTVIQKTIPIEFTGVMRDRITSSAYSVTADLFTTESRLAESEVTATVNLTGLPSGEHHGVPVTINTPEQISAEGTYKIDVIID